MEDVGRAVGNHFYQWPKKQAPGDGLTFTLLFPDGTAQHMCKGQHAIHGMQLCLMRWAGLEQASLVC